MKSVLDWKANGIRFKGMPIVGLVAFATHAIPSRVKLRTRPTARRFVVQRLAIFTIEGICTFCNFRLTFPHSGAIASESDENGPGTGSNSWSIWSCFARLLGWRGIDLCIVAIGTCLCRGSRSSGGIVSRFIRLALLLVDLRCLSLKVGRGGFWHGEPSLFTVCFETFG